MRTKLSILQEYMTAGEWRRAISLAAKFPRLGAIRGAVLDAQMAFTNPRFTVQIGKDVAACIEQGKSALIHAYPVKH